MTSNRPYIKEYIFAGGARLYSSSLGNVLFGCPPEVLKNLMKEQLPLPDAVVIPDQGYTSHSSHSCLEFPLYHFLFIQHGLACGKKFKVLAEPSVCSKLNQMLKVTLLGPDQESMIHCWKNLNIEKGSRVDLLEQILKEMAFLALKAPDGHTYQLEEMVEFIPLPAGKPVMVYRSSKDHPAVMLVRKSDKTYELTCEKPHKVSLNMLEVQNPIYKTKVVKVGALERKSDTILSIRCVGASEGFDPTDASNGLLFRLNGKWVLWDCPAYLHHYLKKINLELEEIDGIFISHVHEDHLEVAETFDAKKKLNLYSTPEIYHCFLLKVMAVKNCSYEKAMAAYHFHPVYVEESIELFGAGFELFYTSHSIPTLGAKISVPNHRGISKIFISGDNLAKRMLKTLEEKGIYSEQRKAQLKSQTAEGECYDFAFVDAGSGLIHGDPEDFFNVKSPVIYMHTGKMLENLPPHHRQFQSGQRIIVHQ